MAVKQTARNKPNELYITRLYDAPVKLVWDAWTDPKKAAKWWGPRGFTITTHSKDLKVGGTWKYTMHGPDGVDYPNKTTYFEVEKYSRLVYDHGASETTPPLFRVTVDFIDLGEKTRMDMTMTLATPEAAKEIAKFIKMAGGNATWDRLAEYLSESDKFVINRSFAAPIDVVFDMWISPEHIANWLPPVGFKMNYIKADVKPGGTSFYSMSNAEGMTMYGKSTYKEIIKPSLLSYTQVFCDEKGNVSRHPMAPTWPETMLAIVKFSEEENQTTRVTVETEVFGQATSEEKEMFNKAKGGMTQGWTGSFDKLEEYLEKNYKENHKDKK
jgi:uncharacterized protein YndB with AHSA1/START domain